MSNSSNQDFLFVNKTASSEELTRSAPRENAQILSYVQQARRSAERARSRRGLHAAYTSTFLAHPPDHHGEGSVGKNHAEEAETWRQEPPRLPSQYPTHNSSDPFHSTVAGTHAGTHALLRCTFAPGSRWNFLAEAFAPPSLRSREILVTRHDGIIEERQRRCVEDAVLMYATLGYGSSLLAWTTGTRDEGRPSEFFMEKALQQLRLRLSGRAPVVDDWLLISIYSLAIAEVWNGSPSLWEKFPKIHALATATRREALRASRTHLEMLRRLAEENGGWGKLDPYLLDSALLADKYLAIADGKRPVLLPWILTPDPDDAIISNIDLESSEDDLPHLGRNLIGQVSDEQLKRVIQSVVEHARIASMAWENTHSMNTELEQRLFRRHQRLSLQLHQLSFDLSSEKDQCICLTALMVLLGSTSHRGPHVAAQIPAGRLQILLARGVPPQEDGLSGDLLVWILFSGAMYAKSPTGELRFRAPVAPEENRGTIQNGEQPRTCPQGVPLWQAKAVIPIEKYNNPNVPFTVEAWIEDIRKGQLPPPPANVTPPTEDCLFLDVHVPKRVLRKAKNPSFKGAPVLFWIHGGGNVLASKTQFPIPAFFPDGLMSHASTDEPAEDIIFIAINYRLGAFGFSSGPEVSKDGDLNAGFLDQRFALEWVQEYVGLFGGDKERVTVMGESGGGSSALFQMTAYGGRQSPRLFSQVISQSPAAMPGPPPPDTFNDFLALLNVSSIAEARQAPEQAIIAANALQIQRAPTTSYLYSPVVDGDFVTADLAVMLRDGHFDDSISVLSSHNTFEGGFFFDPTVETEEEFEAWLKRSIPGLDGDEGRLQHVANTLYPATFDGSLGYDNQATRQMSVWGEGAIDCTFRVLADAFKDSGYAYEFAIAPGVHIQDLRYTFNSPSSPAPFPKAQNAMQTVIASFVKTGVPRLSDGTPFPHWGGDRSLVQITGTGTQTLASRVNNTRCDWWRDGFSA
ncbi:uncharacterized protein DNG_06962 [Cephalotrichum gorgonifer]|uniref:Carboxylesterase type B domain-containing protein n=1 Tax=Cephalotrichum gorgonifer TaxID=2041049 RepID=A0AAE8N2F5_9PEZI|nr:uncharacterized protein DNG_06962 [Cephalotrichum gorgonifer]